MNPLISSLPFNYGTAVKKDNKEMNDEIKKKHFKYYVIQYLLFYLIFSAISFFYFYIIIVIKDIYENYLLYYIALFIHDNFNYPRIVAVAISVLIYISLFVPIFISYKISMNIVHKIMLNWGINLT